MMSFATDLILPFFLRIRRPQFGRIHALLSLPCKFHSTSTEKLICPSHRPSPLLFLQLLVQHFPSVSLLSQDCPLIFRPRGLCRSENIKALLSPSGPHLCLPPFPFFSGRRSFFTLPCLAEKTVQHRKALPPPLSSWRSGGWAFLSESFFHSCLFFSLFLPPQFFLTSLYSMRCTFIVPLSSTNSSRNQSRFNALLVSENGPSSVFPVILVDFPPPEFLIWPTSPPVFSLRHASCLLSLSPVSRLLANGPFPPPSFFRIFRQSQNYSLWCCELFLFSASPFCPHWWLFFIPLFLAWFPDVPFFFSPPPFSCPVRGHHWGFFLFEFERFSMFPPLFRQFFFPDPPSGGPFFMVTPTIVTPALVQSWRFVPETLFYLD